MGNTMNEKLRIKGKDWHFIKYVADYDDLEAIANAHNDFKNKSDGTYFYRMNDAERNLHCFNAGFYRGISWTIAKYGIKI